MIVDGDPIILSHPRRLDSCSCCLMLWTLSFDFWLWRRNLSMAAHISSRASTSSIPLVPSAIWDLDLMLTMAQNG